MLLSLQVLLFGLGVSRPLRAEEPRGSPATDGVSTPRDTPPSEREAREHFERALSEYRAGNYRGAIEELDVALALDPTGKDLVFNLALVHEKLGELDRAITYLERFAQMETDPVERARAEQAITRIRGARRYVAQAELAGGAAVPLQPIEKAERYGRFDGWVLGTGVLAAAAVVVGVVFGVRALDQQALFREESGEPDATAADVDALAERAHSAALISNVALSLGIVAGSGAVVLYFARPELPESSGRRAPPNGPQPRVFALAVKSRF